MDIKIERTFDAPLERVWKAWTSPEEVMKWWGPKHFTAPSVDIDFKEGGKFFMCMRGAMGPGQPETDNWSGGVYKEIAPLKKIVASDYFTDKNGNKISANEAGMPGEWPEEMTVTVTFEEVDGKTKFTLLHEGHPEEMAELAQQGWNESLDKFAAIL